MILGCFEGCDCFILSILIYLDFCFILFGGIFCCFVLIVVDFLWDWLCVFLFVDCFVENVEEVVLDLGGGFDWRGVWGGGVVFVFWWLCLGRGWGEFSKLCRCDREGWGDCWEWVGFSFFWCCFFREVCKC